MNAPRFPIKQGSISDPTLFDRNPPPAATPGELGWQRLHSRRGEPLFLADWERAVFIHFSVEPQRLQHWVPFPLDCRDGSAWVSLVAFTMRDMRPRLGGSVGRRLFAPIATHAFLNVRTYVVRNGEPGIHFLAEWLTNRLAVLLGPVAFGLPYRLGRIDYHHEPENDAAIEGRVTTADGGASLLYHADWRAEPLAPCTRGSLDEFLLERYTAYVTWAGGRQPGFFRIWHRPWPQCRIDLALTDRSLLERAPGGRDWGATARFTFANYSPGCREVLMGRPGWINPRPESQPN